MHHEEPTFFPRVSKHDTNEIIPTKDVDQKITLDGHGKTAANTKKYPVRRKRNSESIF
jgi:hypothetical protein